jgi:hypothetical protein
MRARALEEPDRTLEDLNKPLDIGGISTDIDARRWSSSRERLINQRIAY